MRRDTRVEAYASAKDPLVDGAKAVVVEEKKVASANTPESQNSKKGLHKRLRTE